MSTIPTGNSPYTGWMQYSLANLLSPKGEAILTDGSISVFDSYGKCILRARVLSPLFLEFILLEFFMA